MSNLIFIEPVMWSIAFGSLVSGILCYVDKGYVDMGKVMLKAQEAHLEILRQEAYEELERRFPRERDIKSYRSDRKSLLNKPKI